MIKSIQYFYKAIQDKIFGEEVMKKKKIIFIVIVVIIILGAVCGIIALKNKNSNKISTFNIHLSKEVKQTINDKEIEKMLEEYIVEELNLFNNNEDYDVINQTDEVKALEDKIRTLKNTETDSDKKNIYNGILSISAYMILNQNLIEINASEEILKDSYEEYLSTVKVQIEQVLDKYCK
jgi:preprotein translocase subunit SecF